MGFPYPPTWEGGGRGGKKGMGIGYGVEVGDGWEGWEGGWRG